MGIVNILSELFKHPLSANRKISTLKRFLFWQISSKIHPYRSIVPFVNDSSIIIKKGLSGATGNFYSGLHEFDDMSLVIHFLRENDLFFDIGANIGSYSIIASSVSKANVISIEPNLNTFELLNDNIRINRLEQRITPLNIGIASEKGELKFTNSFDAMNHVLTDKENLYSTHSQIVKTDTIDNLVDLYGTPACIKIDVEGFESQVIKGGLHTLSNKNVQLIIVELNGSGNRYNEDENKIFNHLLEMGFSPYIYYPFERTLKKIPEKGKHNTVFIKDYEYVAERLRSAPEFSVNGILV